MRKASRRIAELWCKTWHRSPMWPAHGHYRCRTCGREYPVLWEFEQRKLLSRPKNERSPATASYLVSYAIAQATEVAHSSRQKAA